MKIKKYLIQSPAFAVNVAYESVVSAINNKLKSEKLNLLEGLVLTALFFESSSEVTPSQLAEMLKTSRGNISHILSNLEYIGYIKRVVDSNDARKFNIELKAEGKKKAIRLIKYFDSLQSFFEKKLGVENCQSLVKGLNQISFDFKNEFVYQFS